MLSVTRIYEYYKRHGHATEVMGASFRNMGEITELAGCDLLTISPQLLGELEAAEGSLPRKLDAAHAKTLDIPAVVMTEALFREQHAQDKMAEDKLAEGIAGFSKALVELEGLLTARAAAL